MMHLLQTHRLPSDPLDLLRLARGLGFGGAEEFRTALARHGADIRRVFRLRFEEATALRPAEEGLPALFELPLDSAEEAGVALLAPYGFQDPRAAFQRLRALSGAGVKKVTLDAGRSQAVFARLHEKLLREISRHPQPDRALANFEECVATLGARSVFFQLLDESDEALTLFVEICSRTSFIVETLRVYPDLFDEVVDSLLTGRRFDPEDLAREMDALFAPGRSFAQGVFQFKHLHLLLIAIRDLQRLVNLSEVLRQIAELAETILGGVVRASRSAASARFGEWSGPEPRMTVLGLGKLGGQEMNYKSDVDMVLLYEGEGATTRGVGAQEYFERFSHMLLEEAGRADSAGPLLHVDLRLRPLGNHNSLAISTAAWRQYFVAGQARTWERQAFLRARPVAGDRGLAEEVLRFIREELVVGGAAGPASREEAFTDVLEMRRRLEEHAGKGNLKRGRGGIMDVEFLVQGLQLAHGKEHPEILTANTAEGLQSLMAAGILEPRHGSELLTAYQFLRWLENRLALVSEAGERLNSLDGLREEELESLIHKIGYRSSGGESALAIFQSELEYYRRRNRHLLERLLRA
jgi:glutamate-ammonia-ligase adenylyltransferase